MRTLQILLNPLPPPSPPPPPPSLHPRGKLRTRSGSGPIGLVTLLAANAAGCAPIVITDLFESRLKFAQNLVPRVKTVQIQRGQSEEDIAATVKEAAGLAFKVALECTGVESSIRAAIYVGPSSDSRYEKTYPSPIVRQVWRYGLCHRRRTVRNQGGSSPLILRLR